MHNRIMVTWILLLLAFTTGIAQGLPAFKAVAFFTAKNDRAHISFVHEANSWFVLGSLLWLGYKH